MIMSAESGSAIRVFIGEPSTLDPAQGFEHDGALILRFLADPLIEFTPDIGAARPAAAASWEIAPDGRTVRFQLRPEVRFHHGRPVTAADYVYSLSRVVWPETASKIAYNLAVIEGFDEVKAGRDRRLRGVRALAEHELEIRLSQPFHEVAAVFGHRVTAAVPEELAREDPERFRVCPVSTGPYQVLGEWKPEHGVTLTRFPEYHGRNEAFPGGGGGTLDRIEFRTYDDVDVAYQDWQRGDLDVTKVPPYLIEESFAAGESFRRTPCALMQYIGFPTEVWPFNDPQVRRAVAMSVDRERIIKEAFAGTRPLANRILPPTLAGADAAEDLLGVPYDPVGARALLAARNVPTDLRLPLRYNAGLGHDKWLRMAAADIHDALGWEITPEPMPWTQFGGWLRSADSLFRMTWAMDYASADNFLYPLFHSASIGGSNFTRFADPGFDETLAAARSTADPARRAELYRRAEERACAALPLLPLWFGVQYHLVRLDRFAVDGPPVDVFGEPSLRQYRLRAAS
jgi:oligopeptide transport system substrate-binding protein